MGVAVVTLIKQYKKKEVVERLIKQMIDPYFEKTISYGENQFAYRAKRGARDVFALDVRVAHGIE